MRTFLSALFTFVLFGCAHMESGHNVYWPPGTTLEQVAREQGVGVSELRELNPHKSAGQWVFVPNQIGLLPYLRGTRVLDDYSQLERGEFAWPVPKVRTISSGFGSRWGRKHEGIDIPAPIGTPVVAVQDGVVKYADNKMSGYGNLIILEHPGKVFSVYAHLNRFFVRPGERVKRGQQIAHTGNTGRSSGPHLHFEIRVRDKARDPSSYLGQAKKKSRLQ